jgi:hypothetical protein
VFDITIKQLETERDLLIVKLGYTDTLMITNHPLIRDYNVAISIWQKREEQISQTF